MRLSRYDDNLHQVAKDVSALEAAIIAAQRQLSDLTSDVMDASDAARLESYIGEALRILGRHDEAIAAQRSAIARLDRGGFQRPLLAYSLRLAEAQRVSGNLEPAERGFRDSLSMARSDSELANYEDFALQHLGKCLLDQGRLGEAAVSLRDALVIRRRNGDAEPVASTEAALHLVERRQSSSL